MTREDSGTSIYMALSSWEPNENCVLHRNTDWRASSVKSALTNWVDSLAHHGCHWASPPGHNITNGSYAWAQPQGAALTEAGFSTLS